MTSVFARYHRKNYPYRFTGKLRLDTIAGGVPVNPEVLKGHLERRIVAAGGGIPDSLILDQVREVMQERGLDPSQMGEAIDEVAKLKGLVGFRRDEKKGFWIPGANLKACLVESASIAAAEGRIKAKGWGQTSHNKGIVSWLKEHLFVEENELYFGVDEPTEVLQSFIHKMTPKGPSSAVQMTEILRDVDLPFTVETDHDFPADDWGAIWVTAERNGLGAMKSQGYGTFEVREWAVVETSRSRKKAA